MVSLLQFPSVVAMMNDELDWTQRLGDAFLAQQPQVMDTVQALRARAQQAGTLRSTDQQTVSVQDQAIVIQPPTPQTLYVPYYNPVIVYGPWWWPAHPPWYWVPPPIYRPPGFGQVVAGAIFFGIGVGITNAIWNDYRPSWRDRQINVVHNVTIVHNQRPPPPGPWRHDPVHRKGIAYRDDQVRDRVSPGQAGRPAARPGPGSGPGDRRPGRGDDPALQPRPSIGAGANAGARPGQPDTRPPGRPGEQPAPIPPSGPNTRPTPTPAPLPGPGGRPATPPGPSTRPAPARPQPTPPSPPQMRPSPISPATSREAMQAQGDRGQRSREAMAAPAARPAPAPRANAAPDERGKRGAAH